MITDFYERKGKKDDKTGRLIVTSLLERLSQCLEQVYSYPRNAAQFFKAMLHVILKVKSAPILIALSRKLTRIVIAHPVSQSVGNSMLAYPLLQLHHHRYHSCRY